MFKHFNINLDGQIEWPEVYNLSNADLDVNILSPFSGVDSLDVKAGVDPNDVNTELIE